MPLAPGRRLGPYEIAAPIGAGGMGEVYRARDTRLGRDVAIKVLPEALSKSGEAAARFEREARAVAALSHPNILAIHDFGRDGETTYAVMELLEGETLRQRIAKGTLPIQKAVDFAAQMASGLAAAHERGIVHRDLKPENLFLTGGGLVKVLDFGLARQVAMPASDSTASPTIQQLTEPGVVAGTVGYMSPEQVRGEPADHRSDVFSFGSVLHEMLGGRKAFDRATGAETMTAILREEPEALATLRPEIPPLLAQIVAHCMEKSPADRFQSMRDVAFNLKAMSSATSTATQSGQAMAMPPAHRRGWFRPLGWIAAALAGAALAWLAITLTTSPPAPPVAHKLTFQAGMIYTARFAPDGQSVLYGAAWGGKESEVYSARLDGTASRPMDVAGDVLAVSPSGEMAVSLGRKTVSSLLSTGTLARAPLGGGAPREILDGVVDADWSPDGSELAVTREAGGEALLEYPIGKVLQRGAGYFSTPRVSPKGDAVAFVRHNVKGDDRGVVALADLSGNVKVLTPDLPSVTGVAWSPDGSEVWLSAWIPPDGYTIEAVTPGGRRRILYRSTERTRLFDVRGDTLLVGTERAHAGVSGILRGQDREQDLSFLDGTCATDLSDSGDEMLFSEGWIGGGPGYSFFLRDASGTFPVRLGTGWGSDLSPDGKWTLSYPVDPPMKLTITPTGTGTPRTIDLKGFEAIGGANWFPDGQRVLVWASEKGASFRGYVMDLPDGKPRVLTPPGVTPALFTAASHTISPDGRLVAVSGADGNLTLYPVDGGEPRTIPGIIQVGEQAVAWTGDGKGLLIREAGVPSKVYRVDVETGRRSLWKELRPADPSGVVEILGVVVTPDLEHYAYTYMRVLTDLYTIKGVK